MNKTFINNYEQTLAEKEMQDFWFSSDVYHWNENEEDKSNQFVIDTPPPTVSGLLHMGHVFSYCHADFIARYNRMIGKNVFYPIGFDDNGLPTERLVEKVKSNELKQKIRGVEMEKSGRGDEFRKMCFEVVNESEKEFEKLFKLLGFSYDWRQKYQTISDQSTQLAHLSFADLLDKDLVYQKEGPVYWDVIDQTALAQSTIEDMEMDGEEFRLLFEIETSQEKLEIMTTRPEMLKACVAIFFNNEDPRFLKYKDKKVKVPYFNHLVPILSDEHIKLDKGTGIVMCCSYGDWQDVEWIRKYNLKSNIIISNDGKIDSLSISDYRKKLIESLEQGGFLVSRKVIKHVVKIGERSKEPIEIIESKQWYLKSLEFKNDLLEIIKHIDFHPSHMKHRLEQWIQGLNQDWCISRDRSFGIKIPNSHQIFDTWFTSGTSPQLNSLGINEKHYIDQQRHQKLFPQHLRPQAHEIIRTWTFSTVLKAYLHGLTKEDIASRHLYLKSNTLENIHQWINQNFTKSDILNKLIPWKNVMLSGWCLAKDGTKMSKSKGNVVTPFDLIQEKGTDIIRYWSASSALGVDTAYSEVKFIDGRRLVNKIWNAFKFVDTIIQNSGLSKDEIFELKIDLQQHISCDMDKWILNRLYETINSIEEEFQSFEYSKAKDILEKFFWHDFCDNYLEIAKYRAYNKDQNNEHISALITLITISDFMIKMFAPFLPHISEYIYQIIRDESDFKSIHEKGTWPNKNKIKIETTQEIIEQGDDFVFLLAEIRKYKSLNNLSIKNELPSVVINKKLTTNMLNDFKKVCNIADIKEDLNGQLVIL